MRLIHIACNSFIVGLLSIWVVNRDLHLDFEVLQVSKFADSTSKWKTNGRLNVCTFLEDSYISSQAPTWYSSRNGNHSLCRVCGCWVRQAAVVSNQTRFTRYLRELKLPASRTTNSIKSPKYFFWFGVGANISTITTWLMKARRSPWFLLWVRRTFSRRWARTRIIVEEKVTGGAFCRRFNTNIIWD